MITDTEKEFLIQSNLIEDVGEEGLADSIKAWEYIKKKDVITKRTILHVHKLIMRNLWPEIAGKLRMWNVKINYREHENGRLKTRYCPHWLTIKRDLPNIIQMFNTEMSKEHMEEWTQLTHIKLLQLHIHADGNGRTGRILYNWHRVKSELPLHIIKHSERFEYYGWFKE